MSAIQQALISYKILPSSLLTLLRAYYTFNSNSNDTLATYNWTDNNTPTYTSWKISNALTLSSGSSQYVSLPNGVMPWGTNTYSVNMWVKLTSISWNQSFLMTARTGQWILFYFSWSLVDHAKPNVVSNTYTWWAADTNWHMWTFVWDGSWMRTYLDWNTTPVESNANTANIVAPSTDTIEIWWYRSWWTIQSWWYMWGQIDEVWIWNKALTTTEITALYNWSSWKTYPF